MLRSSMQRDSDWLDKHPNIHARFMELEDWCEYLEDKINQLEQDSHPAIGLCEFDGYKDLVKRITELEEEVDTLKREG